jgi:hypothetical protein
VTFDSIVQSDSSPPINERCQIKSKLLQLKRELAALRCGLDYDGTWGAEGSRCAELLKTNYSKLNHAEGKPLPFDVGRAHALYKALFGQVEDVIKDKHLLIVPSGR